MHDLAIRRRRAIAIFAITASLSAFALVLLSSTWAAPGVVTWGFRGYAIILAMGGALVGLVLSLRVPGNRVGWLIAGIGLLTGIQAIAEEYMIAGLIVSPGSLPVASAVAWLDGWIWVWPTALAAIALPLIFPTGRLSVPGDRWIARFAAVAVVASTVGLAVAPGTNATVAALANPFHLAVDPATLSNISGLSYPPLGIAAMLSAISVTRRFRRSSGEIRQQLKWFAFAAIGLGIALGTGLTILPAVGGVWLIASACAIVGAFLGMQAAVAIAVLRYRLYDIDRIVSRSISYGAVTAMLLAAYAGAILLLQGPLGSITGGDTIPVAISTLLVASLFNPVRRRVQSIVDRRFDRGRFDTERTTAAFAERLREQVDLPALVADLDTTIRVSIAPSSVGLWLRRTDR